MLRNCDLHSFCPYDLYYVRSNHCLRLSSFICIYYISRMIRRTLCSLTHFILPILHNKPCYNSQSVFKKIKHIEIIRHMHVYFHCRTSFFCGEETKFWYCPSLPICNSKQRTSAHFKLYSKLKCVSSSWNQSGFCSILHIYETPF